VRSEEIKILQINSDESAELENSISNRRPFILKNRGQHAHPYSSCSQVMLKVERSGVPSRNAILKIFSLN
jgi:hypothetical protein